MNFTHEQMKQAIKITHEQCNDQEALEAFIGLYSILGKEELYDGIVIEMEDNCFDDFIYTLHSELELIISEVA